MQNQHESISSDRVEGTAIYGSDGDKIGTVDCILIEKQSGQAREVVADVGGFLGMGGTRHTIPWQMLEYDKDRGGYLLDITEEQLKNAPSYGASEREQMSSDFEHRAEVYGYYAVPTYW